MDFRKVLKSLIKKLDIKLSDGFLNYISSGEALPSPLTPEEEKEVLDLLQKGNNDAKTKLIEHNLRLVVYIAKRFDNTGIDMEDLISVGTIGLIKGVNSYNSDKNIKLATYASRCIENEILMYLRKMVKVKAEVSFDEPLNTDSEGNVLSLADVLGTDGDTIFKNLENNVERDLLSNSFHKLNNRDKLIMELRYGLMGRQEKTQKEIADMMGISQSYISRLEKRILERLKKDMSKYV